MVDFEVTWHFTGNLQPFDAMASVVVCVLEHAITRTRMCLPICVCVCVCLRMCMHLYLPVFGKATRVA